MGQKIKKLFLIKSIVILAVVGLLSIIPAPAEVQAQLTSDQNEEMEDQASAFRQGAGYEEDTTVGGVIATGIKMVLGLLAMVFLIIMIVNGFKWMTAGGNEDKVKEAKNSIRNAIIGLIIVIAAYSITYFVFDVLSVVGGGSGTTGSGGF